MAPGPGYSVSVAGAVRTRSWLGARPHLACGGWDPLRRARGQGVAVEGCQLEAGEGEGNETSLAPGAREKCWENISRPGPSMGPDLLPLVTPERETQVGLEKARGAPAAPARSPPLVWALSMTLSPTPQKSVTKGWDSGSVPFARKVHESG